MTITSEAEWDEIQRQLGDLCGKWCWIGASDETDEGQWRWVTGEPWSYSRWCAEEPNNLNNEDYAELDGNCSRCPDSAWNDTAGKTSSYYLLETDGGQAATATVEYVRYVAPTSDLFAGLVAYYPFNGNAHDESGNGHDGTVYGPVLTTDRLGQTNTAYRFDGRDDYIQVADRDDLDLVDDFTISAWICPLGFSANPSLGNIVVCKHVIHDNYDGSWDFQIYQGCPYFDDMHGGVLGSPLIRSNTWTLITLVYDDTAKICRWYVNGVPDTQTNKAIDIQNTTKSLMIGREENRPDGNFFNGMIDEVRLYNRVLSSHEVGQLYEQGSTSNGETVLYFSKRETAER